MPTQFKSMNRVAHHVTSEDTTLVEVLTKHFHLDDEQQNLLFRLGSIYFQNRRVDGDLALPKGSYLRLHLKPRRFKIDEIDWQKRIVHQTNDYLLLDKPVGIPVVSTVDNQIENLLSITRDKLKIPVFVTHRLDVGVGGLLLFAKNQRFQTLFNDWLAQRTLKKIYRALVNVPVPLGRLVHFMKPSEHAPRIVQITEEKGWHRCELSVHRCEPFVYRNASLFELSLELHTGRTHQIRAQLSSQGAPLLGDRLYGAPKNNLGFGEEKISLYASELDLPTGEKFECTPWWS